MNRVSTEIIIFPYKQTTFPRSNFSVEGPIWPLALKWPLPTSCCLLNRLIIKNKSLARSCPNSMKHSWSRAMGFWTFYGEKILRMAIKQKPFLGSRSGRRLNEEQGREMRNDSGVYVSQKRCVNRKCANTYSRSFQLIGLTILINSPDSAKQPVVPDSGLNRLHSTDHPRSSAE